MTYDVLGSFTTKAEKRLVLWNHLYADRNLIPEPTMRSGNFATSATTTSVTQYSYDALNRVVCTAVRMNADVYGALPADACAPSAVGAVGPDRISRATYDAAGHVMQTETGVGSPLQQVTARYGYSRVA